ncbi:septum formation family protein [Streptomyces mirabilis]|uniref:septum formation family protein n=1 Tax=Streptomyces mirabilis TaxID=68239 RepID=UPI0037F4CAA1
MPYGETVGLTRALHPGDCVAAAWATGKFKGLPNLGTIDCKPARPDAQVIKTATASSPNDAQKNGDSRCATLLAGTVNAMADARSYALPPSKQGWEGGTHSIACLIFNKTTTVDGSIGAFRKFGDPVDLTNSSVGDCYNDTATATTTTSTLARCTSPHDSQVVGFVTAPASTTYKTAQDNANTLCANKYGSSYEHGVNWVKGYISDEGDWKYGFRHLQCTVERNDGKKLTSSTIAAPESTSS